MGKKFDEQMVCNCSLSRKWWWGSIKVFDSPTKFLVYLDKEGSIDFDQANVKKVTVAYLCNRIDDGGGEFEGTDSHWAVCEPTANGAFAVWEINLSTLYSDPPSPERVCPKAETCDCPCQGKHPHKKNVGCTNKPTEGCPDCVPVSSPEPPEKVGFNHIPTDDELDLITTVNGTLQEEYRRQALKTYNATLKLLQQAGWGNLKEAQKHIELLESENYAYQDKESELQVRIKELEKQNEQLRIGELVITTEQKQKEQIIAEARQQALKTIGNYIIDKCYWDENVKAFAVNEQFIENLKQGELPKE